MQGELTQALVEQYRRMDAQYRALGARLRAALGKRGTEPERTELFRQLQELQAKIEFVRQELCKRKDARPSV